MNGIAEREIEWQEFSLSNHSGMFGCASIEHEVLQWSDRQSRLYEAILQSELPFAELTRQAMLLEADYIQFQQDVWSRAAASELCHLEELMGSKWDEARANFFQQYVAIGKREGFIRQELDEDAVKSYFMVFRQLMIKWSREEQARRLSEVEKLVELFFHGIAESK